MNFKKIFTGLIVLLALSFYARAQDSTAVARATAARKDPFCIDLLKVLAAATDSFDLIKGDTIRKTKSIILESKVLLSDMSVSRISIDRTIKQSFYRSFYDGTGNVNVLKGKFEGIKKRMCDCIADKGWIERDDITESDTDYSRYVMLLENPQDDITKEFKGCLLELEVEFEKGSDTEYTIMLTISYY
jgi:hypothetical protein